MQNELIIFGAKYLIFLMIAIAGFAFLFLPAKDKKRNVISGGLVSILSFVAAKILSFFFYNPRPFVVENITPLISHAADNGFPSDHTLLASALAAVVFSFNKKAGLLLWVMALLVGLSRVLAKVHHVTDIVGSILIVLLVTFVIEKFVLPKIVK